MRKKVQPTKPKTISFVIFGGTGDLTKRKLVPAISGLIEEGLVSQNSTIIGVARREHTNQSYRDFLLENASCKKDKACITQANILYFQKDSGESGALTDLVTLLAKVEKNATESVERVFYLATSYTVFPGILKNLKESGLAKGAKIVFEKPFGHDYNSAKQLESQIHAAFSEAQIFRIDHYLGKETVQNINVFKFANPFIDGILRKEYIDSIDIFSDETLGVADRVGYYNESGATRDMIQSHLLQVLSLVLMEKPKSFTPDALHDAKVRVLESLKLLPASTQIIGQYEGYVQELESQGLTDTQTETYVRMGLESTLPRWRGVKLFLQSGKHLQKKSSMVIIYLKQDATVKSFFPQMGDTKIVIDIQPDADIKIYFNTRNPHSGDAMELVAMNFCGKQHFGPNTTDGYKVLLNDVLVGDHTLFTRKDELLLSWKVVDAFLKLKQDLSMHTYKKGTHAFDIVNSCRLN